MKKPNFSRILAYFDRRDDSVSWDDIWEWISSSDKNREEFYRLKELWALRNVSIHASEAEIGRAVRAFNEKIDQRLAQRSWRRLVAFTSSAAAVLVIALLWIGIAYFGSKSEWYTIATGPYDKVKCFNLDDGNKVYLNKSSKLSYRENFNTRRRDVCLSGEAYFEVAHNPQSPFTVRTPDDISIRVLGTSFNVRTGAAMEVVLEKGRVELTGSNGVQLASLSPQQRAIFDSLNRHVAVEWTDTANYTDWRFDRIIYDELTIIQIARLIEDRYNVSVSMDVGMLNNNRYRMVMGEKETLEELLSTLEYLAPIQYQVKGNHVMIKSKKIN